MEGGLSEEEPLAIGIRWCKTLHNARPSKTCSRLGTVAKDRMRQAELLRASCYAQLGTMSCSYVKVQ